MLEKDEVSIVFIREDAERFRSSREEDSTPLKPRWRLERVLLVCHIRVKRTQITYRLLTDYST